MNPEDDWDEPKVKMRTITKTTGFLTKSESILFSILFLIITGLMIFGPHIK